MTRRVPGRPAGRRLAAPERGGGGQGAALVRLVRLPLAAPLEGGQERWVLLRRSVADPAERTAYVRFAPDGATLADLVRVAGRRWTVESCFEAAKQGVGLAEYEVRSRTGWHRHVTLACLAHAFLTVVRAHGVDPLSDGRKGGLPSGSLTRFKASRRAPPLTVPEIRRLLARLWVATPPYAGAIWRWPRWRRRHQAIARSCHYHRRRPHRNYNRSTRRKGDENGTRKH